MTGKMVGVRLRLRKSGSTPLERRVSVDGFVNAFELVVGGYRGAEPRFADSEQEPAVIKVTVPPYHDNSYITEKLLLLAKNCNAEIVGSVSITPVDESPPDPSGYFS